MFELAEKKIQPNALIIYQRDSSQEDDEILEEIQLLAESAGAVVIDTITAFRRSPDPSTYIGKGKVEEIQSIIEITILN